jgi:hypothetical protein
MSLAVKQVCEHLQMSPQMTSIFFQYVPSILDYLKNEDLEYVKENLLNYIRMGLMKMSQEFQSSPDVQVEINTIHQRIESSVETQQKIVDLMMKEVYG